MNKVQMEQCRRKLASGRRVAGTIRSLVNTWDLQLECGRVLHETLLVPVLIYSSETMLCKENEKPRIRAVLNACIRKLCGVMKGNGQRIDEDVLQWFGLVERMENDKIAKRIYVGECIGSHSVDRL